MGIGLGISLIWLINRFNIKRVYHAYNMVQSTQKAHNLTYHARLSYKDRTKVYARLDGFPAFRRLE